MQRVTTRYKHVQPHRFSYSTPSQQKTFNVFKTSSSIHQWNSKKYRFHEQKHPLLLTNFNDSTLRSSVFPQARNIYFPFALSILIAMIFAATVALAQDKQEDKPCDPTSGECQQKMRDMMRNLIEDNDAFIDKHKGDEDYFQELSSGQNPRATVIACADSRVQTTNFDLHPIGDIFFIRNIGNQLETCLGSTDYGVRERQTPLLLILGHAKCGAVTAVTKETEKEPLPESIHNELAPMQLTHRTVNPTDEQIAENVADNVHRQVYKAYARYKERIDEGKLWVVGAVYDFSPKGGGKLTFIQVNDKTDKASIDDFLKDAKTHGSKIDPGSAF